MSASVLFLAAVGLYLFTAAPGLTVEDSAELAAGSRLLAMVHAPGYPLYLLLGRLASEWESYPGRGLVVVSVLCGAFAVATAGGVVARRCGTFAGAAAGITLLFCAKFWEVATEIEVYSLQTLLFLALFHQVWKWRDTRSDLTLRMIGFLLGISLAHHIGILIHLPALLIFLWYHGRYETGPLDVARAGGYLAAGLLLYGALYLLSQRDGIPVVSWLPIRDASMLLHVATGAGFKRLAFAVPMEEVSERLLALPLDFLFWFPVAGLGLIAIGVHAGLRRFRSLTILLLAIIAGTIVQAANYAVLDPDRFLIPAIAPAVLLSGIGAARLRERLTVSPVALGAMLGIFLLSALGGRLIEGGFLGQRYLTRPLDTARHVLSYGQGKGHVIRADWNMYPTLKYVQLVERTGEDVVVEMDSTIMTVESDPIAEKTFVMTPSPELGRTYGLVMENLHWRLLDDSRPLEHAAAPEHTRAVRLEGIAVAATALPDTAERDGVVSFDLAVRRTGPIADSATCVIRLMREELPRLSVPIRLLHWKFDPPEWREEITYREPVSLFLPSAYRDEIGVPMDVMLTLRTATGEATGKLGTITFVRKRDGM